MFKVDMMQRKEKSELEVRSGFKISAPHSCPGDHHLSI